MRESRKIISGFLLVLLMLNASCIQAPPEKLHFYNGLKHGAKGNLEKARQEFKNAMKYTSDPEFTDATKLCIQIIEDATNYKIKKEAAVHLFKGERYGVKIRRERYSKRILRWVLSELDKAIAIEPDYAPAYRIRGTRCGYVGLYDQAISDFTKVIELDPQDAIAYHNRGVHYADKKLFEEALADLNKAIQINPKRAITYLNKAFVCEKLFKRKMAAQAYRSFLQYAHENNPFIEKAKEKLSWLEGFDKFLDR